MKSLEWILSRTFIVFLFFSFGAWTQVIHTTLTGNVNAYVTTSSSNHNAVPVCTDTRGNSLLRAGMSAKVIGYGNKMAKVKFGNDAQPTSCRNKWAWVPYENIRGVNGRPAPAQTARQAQRARTEAGVCPNGNCDGRSTQSSSQTQSLANLAGILNPDGGFQPLFGAAGRTCSSFVRSNGQLGDFGRRTLAAIRAIDPDNSCFLGGGIPISDRVCPNYKHFSPQQRERYWVYHFAAMAYRETSCNPEISGDGGRSDGLFQLEFDNQLRKTNDNHGRNRGPACKPGIPWNTRELNFQFNCTASIMKLVNCRRNLDKPLGNGTRGSVAWSGLIKPSGKLGVISSELKKFPGCW